MFLWGLAGACATYENTEPDHTGTPGNAGSEAGGSAGAAEIGGSGGGSSSSSGTGGATTGGAPSGSAGMPGGMGGMAGGRAGAGGLSAGGASGHAGVGGGGGGAAGSGGKASGGSGGAGGKSSGGSAGTGGSGGSSATQTCAKNPIPIKSTWVVTASASRDIDPVTNAHDGVLTNRWSTGQDQVAGQWLQVDFGVAVTLTRLTLVLGSASVNDYPRTYATRFSNTPLNQAAPVLVSGMGAAGADTVMNFPPGTTGRYVLITQGGAASGLWWSVAEIQAACAD